jgi:hypothetical protein
MVVAIPALPHHSLFLLITLTHPNFPLHHRLFPLGQSLFQLSLLHRSSHNTIAVAQLGFVQIALVDVPHPAGHPLTAFSLIVLLSSHHLLTVLLFLPQAISVREATTRRSSIRAREAATGQTRMAISVNGKTSEHVITGIYSVWCCAQEKV